MAHGPCIGTGNACIGMASLSQLIGGGDAGRRGCDCRLKLLVWMGVEYAASSYPPDIDAANRTDALMTALRLHLCQSASGGAASAYK